MRRPRIPPAPSLPEVEEAGPARAYWFEGFRRVLLVPDNECIVFSIDVYRVMNPAPEGVEWGPRIGGVKLGYVPLREAPSCCGAYAADAVAVMLSTSERTELISARLRFCGISLHDVSQDEVWRLYRGLVERLEGRAPAVNPLRVPEPVETVYASRLAGSRRGPRS